ncbi:MAG: hypothetical protein AAGI27_07225 [Pseudomonadota bacterium]
MNRSKLFTVLAAGALVAACDSGDITLAPTNVDNSQDNSNQGNTVTTPPTTVVNPCASFTVDGVTSEGAVESVNVTAGGTTAAEDACVYGTDFVADTRPLTVSSVRFEDLGTTNNLHIFDDSLFIGEDVSETDANLGERIPQEGEGTTVFVDAGVTMVFRSSDSYVRVARGSQLVAVGTAAAPITFTADEDALLGVGTESDRGLWGGLQLNGNGNSNKCHDGTATGNGAGTVSDFAPTANNVHGCHATAEGRPATYGGGNNAESSGELRYVVIKHAGFEVVDGDELNALTMNGVGSGTDISFVQTYTSLDDGFEMFGGAVNLRNIVAVNVGDDSIDYSEGYNGLIQYALVLDTSGANRCIEADNTGGGRDDGITPTTKAWISNLTCITSDVGEGTGTNPSSKGDSEGVLFREGAFVELYNSIVTSNSVVAGIYESDDCWEANDSEGPQTIDAIENGAGAAIEPAGGFSRFASNIIACNDAVESSPGSFANSAIDDAAMLTLITQNNNTNNLIDGTGTEFASLVLNNDGAGNYDRGYLTADSIEQTAGTVAFDQTTQLADLNDAALFPTPAATGFFDTPTFIGAANTANDWIDGWTVGLDLPLTP